MNKQQVQVDGQSISILGLLGVLFIGLKLTGHVAWSWWWVLAPFWGPWAIIISALMAGAIAAVTVFSVAYLMKWYQNTRRKRRQKSERQR